MVNRDALVDPNSSDHIVALTELREQIATLQKQLSLKDGQLLTKEKQVSLDLPFCLRFHFHSAADSLPTLNPACDLYKKDHRIEGLAVPHGSRVSRQNEDNPKGARSQD